ncbi:MAG: hypothetical protein AAF590_07865 [Pseudomonadota bacterium]
MRRILALFMIALVTTLHGGGVAFAKAYDGSKSVETVYAMDNVDEQKDPRAFQELDAHTGLHNPVLVAGPDARMAEDLVSKRGSPSPCSVDCLWLTADIDMIDATYTEPLRARFDARSDGLNHSALIRPPRL